VTPVHKLIAGNLEDERHNRRCLLFAESLSAHIGSKPLPCDMLICPPATPGHVALGAAEHPGREDRGQDCHAAAKGAHTGDLAAAMFADLNCSHVIVGHSRAPRRS